MIERLGDGWATGSVRAGPGCPAGSASGSRSPGGRYADFLAARQHAAAWHIVATKRPAGI